MLDVKYRTDADHKTSTGYDLSMFAPPDLLNIILQRSEVLYDISGSGRIIRHWSNGNTAPIDRIVAEKGTVLAQRALDIIKQEFIALRPVLDRIKPSAFADIGCGYGFLDIFIAQTYDARAHLIDLEQNTARHFGFGEESAAYSSLSKAARFMAQNKIATHKIHTHCPARDDLSEIKDLDLIISTLACGFHFPVDAYIPFFRSSLRKGGSIIVDLRCWAYQQQVEALCAIGIVKVLESHKKYNRVIVTL